MEIFNDKKNVAIIGGLAGAVVLLLAAYFLFFSGGEGGGGSTEFDDSNTSLAPGSQTATAPPTVPGGPTTPMGPTGAGPTEMPPGGAPGGAPGGTPVLTAKGDLAIKPLPPTDAHRQDPFSPLIKIKKPSQQELLARAAEQEITTLPPLSIYQVRPSTETTGNGGGSVVAGGPLGTPDQQPDTSTRRVAGIVTGKNAYAILEVDGQTAVVKPGDVLPDLSRVERIERDRILLRKGDRGIFVPLANSDQVQGGGGGGGGGAVPGGRPGAGPYGPGGRRGAGVPPPGAFRGG